MSKLAKAGILAAVIVVAAAALAITALGKLNAPEKAIKDFITAIATQNYPAFSKVTEAKGGKLELTEDMVAPFFALTSARSDTLDRYQSVLQNDLSQLKQEKPATGNGFLCLVEHDHIFYKSYTVALAGIPFFFRAPLDNTQITVTAAASAPNTNQAFTLDLPKGGESAQLALLPGRYDITATYKGGPLNETFTSTLTNYELSDASDSCDIGMEYSSITVLKPSYPMVGLTVNGVAMSNLTSDELLLSPLPKEVEIVAQFNVDGVQVTDSRTYTTYIQDSFQPQAPAPSRVSPLPGDTIGAVSEYIFPGDAQYLALSDLNKLNREEIMMLRNEFFARHGCTFNDSNIRTYFESKSWYAPVEGLNAGNFNTAVFSTMEKANVDLILQYERDRGWRN